MARNRSANREVRRERRDQIRNRRRETLVKATMSTMEIEVSDVRHCKPPKNLIIEPKTAGQELYDRSIAMNTITISTGPWGTGKTWLATARAAQAFRDGETKQLVFTRPVIEAGGEEMGFLPGTIDEKFEPYFRPLRNVLNQVLGSGAVDYAIRDGRIEARPLAFLRGETFTDTWVIADEMQNSRPSGMKMLLSRIGEGTKMILNGDPRQKDIEGLSGLEDAIARIHGRVGSCGLVEFDAEDIVRSGIAREIFLAYHA